MGLGDPSKATTDTWRKAGAQAVRWGNQQKCKTLAIACPVYNGDKPLTAQTLAEGILLASHQDKRFRSQSPNGKNADPTVSQVELLELEDQSSAIATAQTIVKGVILARELVSAPANIVTPSKLAETAQEIAQACPLLSVEILEREDCAKLGMGAFLGVAQASSMPPSLSTSPTKMAVALLPRKNWHLLARG